MACTRSIPTTVILPQLELDGDDIETLQELTKQCRVDAQSAQASVPEDAVAIKQKIMEAVGAVGRLGKECLNKENNSNKSNRGTNQQIC